MSSLGPSSGSEEALERRASQANSRTRQAAIAVFASARGPERPPTNGAAAIRIQASRRPTTPAQASVRCTGWPLSAGTIENAAIESDPTRNPVLSNRSRRRPSTA